MTDSDSKVLENDIKSILINHLRKKGWFNDVHALINEFTVDNSSRRVDLCVIKKDLSVAFEIKSEADSLARLDGQVTKYLEYFDKVIVVASKKHIPGILVKTPINVAVWEVTDRVKIIRRGCIKRRFNITRFIDLMTVIDLRRLVSLHDGCGVNKNRYQLGFEVLKIPPSTVRTFALNALIGRYMLTTNNFWENVGNGLINKNHLSSLSMQKVHSPTCIKNIRGHLNKVLFNDDPHLITLSKDGKIFGEVPKEISTLLQSTQSSSESISSIATEE